MAIEIVKRQYHGKDVDAYEYKIDASSPLKNGDWIIDSNYNLWCTMIKKGYEGTKPGWSKVIATTDPYLIKCGVPEIGKEVLEKVWTDEDIKIAYETGKRNVKTNMKDMPAEDWLKYFKDER